MGRGCPSGARADEGECRLPSQIHEPLRREVCKQRTYVGVDPKVPPGDYELVFKDVPVDAFWSVSVYNAKGFFEPNTKDLYSVNSVIGVRNNDGSITVHFVSSTDGDVPPNAIVTPEGWNYLIRFYRPRAGILDGSWTPPTHTPSNAS